MVQLDGDSVQRKSLHSGLIEHWVSRDSGETWTKVGDSLRLAGLPFHHAGRWWAVREKPGPLELWPLGDDGFGNLWRPSEVVKFYDTIVVVTSTDGRRWDSVAVLKGVSGTTDLRFEVDSSKLWLVASSIGFQSDGDVAWWSLGGAGWSRAAATTWQEAANAGIPSRGTWMAGFEARWNAGFWRVSGSPSPTYGWHVNGSRIPDVYDGPMDNRPRILPLSPERVVLFARNTAISMDSSLTSFHTLSWPGGGFHRELMWGGRILSVSDSGVYLGRILSGLEGGDPRGTWVKKTEVPRVF